MIPLGNYYFLCAGGPHRSEIVVFHALESSTAQESRNPTRWSRPAPRKCRISRAGVVRRAGIVVLHALEESLAQEAQNTTRRTSPYLRKRAIPRASVVQHPANAASPPLDNF